MAMADFLFGFNRLLPTKMAANASSEQ